jgi:hypothetical protein
LHSPLFIAHKTNENQLLEKGESKRTLLALFALPCLSALTLL